MRAKLIGFLTASIAFGVAQSGFAADMPAKAPVYKAPIAGAGPACTTCVTQVQGGKGWLARIGLGYDYQFTQRIVGGVFGDLDLASLEGTVQDGGPFRTGQIKEKSAWAAGVRAGWLLGPKTLSYINGGY